MKRKTVENRRKKSAKYFELGDNSKYGKKVSLQKKGKFSSRSPFICSDIGTWIELKKFNQIRFRPFAR